MRSKIGRRALKSLVCVFFLKHFVAVCVWNVNKFESYVCTQFYPSTLSHFRFYRFEFRFLACAFWSGWTLTIWWQESEKCCCTFRLAGRFFTSSALHDLAKIGMEWKKLEIVFSRLCVCAGAGCCLLYIYISKCSWEAHITVISLSTFVDFLSAHPNQR